MPTVRLSRSVVRQCEGTVRFQLVAVHCDQEAVSRFRSCFSFCPVDGPIASISSQSIAGSWRLAIIGYMLRRRARPVHESMPWDTYVSASAIRNQLEGLHSVHSQMVP